MIFPPGFENLTRVVTKQISNKSHHKSAQPTYPVSTIHPFLVGGMYELQIDAILRLIFLTSQQTASFCKNSQQWILEVK